VPARLADVTRGGAVESVHYGVIAVVDGAGELVASVGDPDHFAYFRSSAKPIQAIPVIESGAADAFGFTPAELALCCASHHAEPHHQAEVAAMLAKIGLGPEWLQCGAPLPGDDDEAARVAAGLVPRSPLQCDCSGKHSGMLAACVKLGLPLDSYLDPAHPLQRQVLGLISDSTRTPIERIRLGTDGCSLPTFGGTIRGFASAYAAIAAPDRLLPEHAPALTRLRKAMTSHPENVAGSGNVVTDLMAVSGGAVVAKSGAEGLLCLALPDREVGVAIRVLDGSYRALAVVACKVLSDLRLVPQATIDAVLERHDPRVYNHTRRHVGEIVPAFAISS
jgi:L-asparaginase II